MTLLLSSCTNSDDVTLKISKIVPLRMSEPSGLCYNFNHSGFFAVNDSDNGRLYELNLDGSVKRLCYDSGGLDYEGCAMDYETGRLYVCSEDDKIYGFEYPDYDSPELVCAIDGGSFGGGKPNNGFEGIEYADGILYLGNQANPRVIVKYDIRISAVIETLPLSRIGYYISDLWYDSEDCTMWILDSAKDSFWKNPAIYHCTLDGKLLKTFSLPEDIVQAEGLVIDKKKNKIYISCDYASNLYILEYDFK